MLSGDNGILKKATDAKTQTGEGQEKEIIALAYNSALTKKVSNGDSNAVAASELNDELDSSEAIASGDTKITVTFTRSGNAYTIDNNGRIAKSIPAGMVVETPNNWSTLQGKAISDGNGTTIPLPKDLYYIGGDYNTGLVVSDKEGDTLNASGISSGNQFVWIPVPNVETFTRTDFDDNGNPTGTIWSEECAEPYTNGYQGEETEYNNMRTQVLKYGGFYLGRYEAGIIRHLEIIQQQIK